MGSSSQPPDGYREGAIGGTFVVARANAFDGIVSALGMGTLHAWASTQPGAVAMQGRATAWATRLPNGEEAVVRHSRHGGLLAPLTGDLFLAPTRAPEELAISVRLRAAGVRTPEVVAYAVYSAFGPLCRADVVTARVPGSDLATFWASTHDAGARAGALAAVAELVRALGACGAVHPDLNARNVLLTETGGRTTAAALDVDRVQWQPRPTQRAAATARAANASRLLMSMKKLFAASGSFMSGDAARLLDLADVPNSAGRLR